MDYSDMHNKTPPKLYEYATYKVFSSNIKHRIKYLHTRQTAI